MRSIGARPAITVREEKETGSPLPIPIHARCVCRALLINPIGWLTIVAAYHSRVFHRDRLMPFAELAAFRGIILEQYLASFISNARIIFSLNYNYWTTNNKIRLLMINLKVMDIVKYNRLNYISDTWKSIFACQRKSIKKKRKISVY